MTYVASNAAMAKMDCRIIVVQIVYDMTNEISSHYSPVPVRFHRKNHRKLARERGRNVKLWDRRPAEDEDYFLV